MRGAGVLSLLLFITLIITGGSSTIKSTCFHGFENACEDSGEVMLMAEDEKKPRKVWLGVINCAHCGKPNSIRVEKEIVEPAVPAETEIRVTVEKSLQTLLA